MLLTSPETLFHADPNEILCISIALIPRSLVLILADRGQMVALGVIGRHSAPPKKAVRVV